MHIAHLSIKILDMHSPVIIISFVLTRALPGDPAVYFAGDMADKESIDQVRRAMGLD